MILQHYQMVLISRFEDNLVGVEMGIAYGGGVEALGALWKGRGQVYGYDTFEGLHPDDLADNKYSNQARCMDHWYNPEVFGTDALNYEWMKKVLEVEHLTNVHLIKGLVTKDSCKDLKEIHYALLDMDILSSMKTGFEAVKNNMAKGGFLFFHDVTPRNHITPLYEWFNNEVLKDKSFKWIGDWSHQFLAGVEKI